MIIRDATPHDAEAASAVLRDCISQLCVADHHNDPEIRSRCLANKTLENVAAWAEKRQVWYSGILSEGEGS